MAGRRRDKLAQDFLRAQARTPMMLLPPKPSINMKIRPASAEAEMLAGVASKGFRIPRLFGMIGG